MIVIGTTPNREQWLAQCLKSIQNPVLILSDFTYELGKINWVYNNTNIERFMFLQDSVVIKDNQIFELLNEKGSIALTNDPAPYGMYMGIYERKILSQINIPLPKSKEESIKCEISWTTDYCRMAKNVRIAFPDLTDKNATKKEILFGRENLVLENDFLIKYKGNWGQG
jgi:hypothetical protein